MSDVLLRLYYTIYEKSPAFHSEKRVALEAELISRLGKGGDKLFEDYQQALYEVMEQEDRAFFLRTLALGMELGRLSVS